MNEQASEEPSHVIKRALTIRVGGKASYFMLQTSFMIPHKVRGLGPVHFASSPMIPMCRHETLWKRESGAPMHGLGD